MGICVNCANKETCTLVSYYEAQGEHVVKCGKRKPITNADRIRAMTDEELAEWFGRIQYDTAYYCAGEGEQKYPYPDGWLDWLRQEDTDEHYHSRG